MRYHNDQLIAAGVPERIDECILGLRVQRACGLIQNENGRVSEQAAGNA